MKCTRWTAVLRQTSLIAIGVFAVTSACSSSSFSNGSSGTQPITDASSSGGAGANGGGGARNAGGVTDNAGGVTSGAGGSNAGGVTSGAGGSNAGGVTNASGAAGTSGGGSTGTGGAPADAGIYGACGTVPLPEPKPLPEPPIPNPDPTATLKEIYVSGPASTYSIGAPSGTLSVFLHDQGVYNDGTVRNIDGIFSDINYQTKVAWTSSDPTIATITSGDTRTAGGIQGLREGTVTITVGVNGIEKSVCFVVTPPVVASLTIKAPSSMPSNPYGPIVAKPGDKIPLTCTETLTDGTEHDVTNAVTWASSVTSVATVSQAGVTDTLSGGTTAITASLPAWVQGVSQSATTGTATLDVIGSTGLQNGDACGGTAQTCAAGLSCCYTRPGTPPSCIPTLSPTITCPPPPPATP
jgi:hypothetical protein